MRFLPLVLLFAALPAAAKDPAAIAVVDSDGLLLGFLRMDGTRPGSGGAGSAGSRHPVIIPC